MAASGLELVQQGFRDLGAGAESFGRGLERARSSQERREEAEAKKTADAVRQDRLNAVGVNVEEAIGEIANDPNATRASAAQRLAGITGEGAALQDPNISRSANAQVEGIFGPREALNRQQEADALAQTQRTEDRTKETRKSRRGLRQNFQKNATTKATAKSRAAFEVIKTSAKRATPAGDVALITAFSKSIDEGARVTDADFKNAESARAALSRLEDNEGDGSIVPAFIKRALQRVNIEDGTKLLPEQRQDFLNTAKEAFRAKLQQQQTIDDDFGREATRSGLNPEDIVGFSTKKDIDAFDKEDADFAAANAKTPEQEQEVVNEEARGSVQFIDDDAFERLKAENMTVVMPIIEQENQARATRGEPPMTPAEVDEAISTILEANGLAIAPEPGQP